MSSGRPSSAIHSLTLVCNPLSMKWSRMLRRFSTRWPISSAASSTLLRPPVKKEAANTATATAMSTTPDHSRMCLVLFMVVGFTFQDGERTVQLFCKYRAYHLVRERHF